MMFLPDLKMKDSPSYNVSSYGACSLSLNVLFNDNVPKSQGST